MRQKATFVVAGACLLSLMTPAPAYAIFGGGWLERLSGPGPFKGLLFDARLLCITGPHDSGTSDRGQQLDDESLGSRMTFPRDRDARVWFTGAGCHFLPPDKPRMEIGVDLGFWKSSENVLDYTNRPGLTDDDKQVRIRTFLVTADLRVNRVFDVGAGIGRASFSSDDDLLFPSFSRTVSQPMRLTTRPLTTFWNGPRSEALVVRFDATKFHGGFTAEDFGAVPGTFNEPGEIIWAWSVRIDAFSLFWPGTR